MHEMSMAVSLIGIIREEMEKHGATRLARVRVRCGVIANVVPESLSMAFEVMAQGTPLEGAELILEEEALRLACGACGVEFSPAERTAAQFSPCPACGEEFGHTVLAGKALYIDNIEVE